MSSVSGSCLHMQGFPSSDHSCVSTHAQGCQFLGSLMRDGSIQEGGGTPRGIHHQLPRLWVKACWSQLGHHQKKISKKVAYTCVSAQRRLTALLVCVFVQISHCTVTCLQWSLVILVPVRNIRHSTTSVQFSLCKINGTGHLLTAAR